ncbi:MAG: hypothetical protein QXJ48_02350 [Candidatus Korarchaeum sp.]
MKIEEWFGERLRLLDFISAYGLPLLGGLPFLRAGDELTFKFSGDVDILAPWERRKHLMREFMKAGFELKEACYTLFGLSAIMSRDRDVVHLHFHTFFDQHDVRDGLGKLRQVSREWDYCFVSIVWRGEYRRRILEYLRRGLMDEGRLREYLLSSPFKEIIASLMDDDLRFLLPDELRGYGLLRAFLKVLLRVGRRNPEWLLLYLLHPFGKLRFLRDIELIEPIERSFFEDTVAIIVAKEVDDSVRRNASILREHVGTVVIASSSGDGEGVMRTGRGKWVSIAEALRRLDAERYLVVDGDLPVDRMSLLRLLSRSGDLVISRRAVDSRSFVDRILTLSFFLLTFLLFGNRYRDVQAGAKVLSRRARELALDLNLNYLGDLVLLLRARRGGLRVVEVPVNWVFDRPRSWGKRIRMILSIMRELPKVRGWI